LTDQELIADLRASFPGIHAEHARQYGIPQYEQGVWIGGEAVMPDQSEIFCTLACSDPDIYNGRVHHAFEAWVEKRGYSLDCYDHGTYFAVPSTLALFTEN
jgi:hypothetical protein